MLIVIILFANFLFSNGSVYFDGSRAKELLDYQCNFGPRFPGSKGHDDFADSLKVFLDKHNQMNLVYKDSVLSPVSNKIVQITNILARFNPRASKRILLLAHWDTREFADKDIDINSRTLPVIGANDGASGTAVLMTLAEILSKNPTVNIGVDLLFLDGEDMGVYGESEGWGLGAKSFSKNIKEPFPEYAICLDMIADKDQEFLIEGFSYMHAPNIVKKVWNLANSLGYNQFKYILGQQIIDDHYVLFQNTGIPSIDIIDFQYPNNTENYWHTTHDTPDKCSAESLEVVGTVIATLIYNEDR